MRRRSVQYVHRRQETTIPDLISTAGVSGSTAIDTAVSQTTALLADTTAVDTGAAITSSAATVTSAASSSSSATSAASAASSASSSSSSLSWSTVIGICVGVFAGLAVLLLLFYYFCVRKVKAAPRSGRGAGADGPRQRSGRELWVKMEDADGSEKYSMKQSPSSFKAPATSGGGGGEVARSITVKSAKSGKTFKSVGWGANLGLADTFRTAEAAPQLEFTDRDMGTGHGFTKSAAFPGNEKAKDAAAYPYPYPYEYEYPKPPPPMTASTAVAMSPGVSVDVARALSNAVSWDGETAADGASYLSLERGSMGAGAMKDKPPSPMSPSQSMVVSYQTPPAVEIKQHVWEAAEVVGSPAGGDAAYGGVADSEPTIQHPFASHYATSTARTSASEDTVRRQPSNPFRDNNPFGAADDHDDEAYTTAPSNTSHSHAHLNTHAYADADASGLQIPPASAGSTTSSFFSTQSSLPSAGRPGAFGALERTAAHHERMESNERAMASLIAALDITPEEARARMSAAEGFATPRASALSGVMTIGTAEGATTETESTYEESVRRFPLPPDGDGGRR